MNEAMTNFHVCASEDMSKIFYAGLLKSSIRDVLWTKYAHEEIENYRNNYTENIEPNWFIDHSCYNDTIERIDYGKYLQKLFY